MIVDCAVYEKGVRAPNRVPLDETFELSRAPNAFAWIGLHEPTEEEFDRVRREFDLHELAVEDARKGHQRPKLEIYGDSLFLVLKTVRYADDQIELGEILVFVGDGFIVTVRHGETPLHEVRDRMERRQDLLQHGPAAALYAIVDRVVDGYLPVIEELDTDITEVEAEVFDEDPDNPAERIYRLSRAVVRLHQAVVPLEIPVDDLARGIHPRIPEEIRPYFRDVHDHLLREMGRIHEFRELLANVLTANHTQASYRQNEDVRKISAWAAIIAVPTLIGSVYGMNFDHMPELGWRAGYPFALGLMAAICLGLYLQFRRSGWL
ncbi:MAG TPA: magnesium/cobalt transporter CorA [Gaiellaceae bacterium]|nr:magnesium/cobalt transporter CorA [Gaiellaceae bacterium]